MMRAVLVRANCACYSVTVGCSRCLDGDLRKIHACLGCMRLTISYVPLVSYEMRTLRDHHAD